jgi:hypothetical protein
MAGITIKKHIQAPAGRVFAAATDFARAPEIIRSIRKVEMLTDGPLRVGTRFRETRILFSREATEELEVTSFEPPHRFALGCENHGCRFHTETTFTSNGTGTDVEMRFQATPLTLAAKMMSAAMKPMMSSVASECAGDLDDLKAAIEGGP